MSLTERSDLTHNIAHCDADCCWKEAKQTDFNTILITQNQQRVQEGPEAQMKTSSSMYAAPNMG